MNAAKANIGRLSPLLLSLDHIKERTCLTLVEARHTLPSVSSGTRHLRQSRRGPMR